MTKTDTASPASLRLLIPTGSVLGKCYRRHDSCKFLDFLKKIDSVVPADLDIHLVLDNYGTHKTAMIRQWLQKTPRYHLHFTPPVPHGSTRSNAPSHCSHSGRSSAARTEAFRNWRPRGWIEMVSGPHSPRAFGFPCSSASSQ
jgi:hypothetical protein